VRVLPPLAHAGCGYVKVSVADATRHPALASRRLRASPTTAQAGTGVGTGRRGSLCTLGFVIDPIQL